MAGVHLHVAPKCSGNSLTHQHNCSKQNEGTNHHSILQFLSTSAVLPTNIQPYPPSRFRSNRGLSRIAVPSSRESLSASSLVRSSPQPLALRTASPHDTNAWVVGRRVPLSESSVSCCCLNRRAARSRSPYCVRIRVVVNHC